VSRFELSQDAKIGFIRCQLDVSTAGMAVLKLRNVKGVTLWLDQTLLPVSESVELKLAAGIHTLTFALDLRERREGWSAILDDKTGVTAQVRIVGGK